MAMIIAQYIATGLILIAAVMILLIVANGVERVRKHNEAERKAEAEKDDRAEVVSRNEFNRLQEVLYA